MTFYIQYRQTQYCGAGAGGVEIILRPGAGAEIICKINIFFSQFGGCYRMNKS